MLLPLPCYCFSPLWSAAFQRVIRLLMKRNYVTDVMIGNFAGLVLSFLAVVLFRHAQVSQVIRVYRIAGTSLSCTMYSDSRSRPSEKERSFALPVAWACEHQYVFICSISLFLSHNSISHYVHIVLLYATAPCWIESGHSKSIPTTKSTSHSPRLL